MTAELHWFPFDVAAWLSSPAVSMMLPEQEGAYLRLLAVAWGNGDVEPSLPNDPRALAQVSRLGARWRKLGALILAQFEIRDGRYYNAKLSAVWLEQQQKHASAVAKASAGGKAKAERERARKAASSTASGSAPSTPGAVLGECSASANLEKRVEKLAPLPERDPNSGVLDLDQERAAAAPLKSDPAPAATAALQLGYGDLPEAAIRFVQRFYPRDVAAPERRRDVAEQLLATLGDGARLNGGARRVRAFTAERLAAKCAEVLASPPKDTDKAIVVLLRKLADTSDGAAPGQVAEREAAVERARDERTGAERTAAAAAWLESQPDVVSAVDVAVAATLGEPFDPANPFHRITRNGAIVRAWTEAGEPEVQHV